MRHGLERASSGRRRRLLLLLLLYATPVTAGPGAVDPVAPGSGDGAGGQVVKVAWSDLVHLVEAHPRLASGRSQVDAARRGVDVAGSVPNPSLEATVGRGVARTGGASRIEWGVALTVPLGWIGQRSARVSGARSEVDAAVAETRLLRRDVLLQLQSLFWNLVFEQARVATLEELQEHTRALTATVRRRVEKGEARPIEGTRVEIELEKVEIELESARTSNGARQGELALWLGSPPGTSLVAVADLGLLPAPLDRETALARVRATHPALAGAQARVQALEAEIQAERRGRLPSLAITGFADDELDRRAYGVGLTVDVPLWNWNSGRIAQAEAQLAAGRYQSDAALRDVEADVLQAQAACQGSVQVAARFKDNVVPRSETAASTIERTYQVGETSLLELIDARRTLLDARRMYLSALSQARIDCSRLDIIVGEEKP